MKEVKITDSITTRTPVTRRYFSEIPQFESITPEEEIKLATEASNGNIESRDKLVTANLRFVISVAKIYHGGNNCRFEDLISEGNLGLVEAAETFDPTRGFKFISHAVWYIKKNILKYLTDNLRTVRLPDSMVQTLRKLNVIEDELAKELERDINRFEVIDEFIDKKLREDGTKSRRLNLEASYYADSKVSSFSKIIPGTDSLSLIDILDGTDEPSDHLVDSADINAKQLLRYLYKLRPMEQNVIRLRLGIGGEEPLTFKEIAELYELGSESIRHRFNR